MTPLRVDGADIIAMINVLKQDVLTRFIENPDYMPSRDTGHWRRAQVVDRCPLASDFLRVEVRPVVDRLLRDFDRITEICRAVTTSERRNSAAFMAATSTTPEKFITKECQRIREQLQDMPMRGLALEDRIDLVRGRSTKTTLDYIYSDLSVQALDFCDDLDRSKVMIASVAEDPDEYIDMLDHRRWDAANSEFLSAVGEDTLLTHPWRKFDDTWVREYSFRDRDGELCAGTFSVRFDPLKTHAAGTRNSCETLEPIDTEEEPEF